MFDVKENIEHYRYFIVDDFIYLESSNKYLQSCRLRRIICERDYNAQLYSMVIFLRGIRSMLLILVII